MAKKKVSKVDSKKKSAPAKSITKSISKFVGKLTKKIDSAAGKASKKAAPAEKAPKTEKKSTAKPVKAKPVTAKSAAKKETTKPTTLKAEKVTAKVAPKEENSGDTLIEMARAEMAAVKIGQTAEKVEKASKFKAIKVERGNLADEKAKWQELNKRYGKDKAVSYKMSETFESLKPVQHKVLGWGFVLTNENDRLEVLFENGIKMLISNYKPN